MGSSKTTVQAPQPSAQELALMGEQTELLRQQRGMLEQQFRTQDLLAPILYRQAGIQPIFSQDPDAGLSRQLADLDTRIATAQGRLDEFRAGPQTTRPGFLGRADLSGGPGFGQQMIRKAGEASLQGEVGTLQKQRDELFRQVEASRGRITGFEELPDSPEVLREKQLKEALSQATLDAFTRERESFEANREIEELTRARSLAALKGELPVNPGLLSQLGREKTTLQETLRKQLGPGFETSTPGIQALAEFSQRESEVLEAARRGDVTLGEQLRMGQEASRRDFGFAGVDLSQRLRQQQLGNIMGVSQAQLPAIQGLSGVAQGFNAPLSFLANNRAQQFQAQQLSAQLSQQNRAGIGQLFGAGLGAYATYAALAASDRRLKTDIELMGMLNNGLPFYRFRYIGDPELRIGVMADEVEALYPDAVLETENGYKLVKHEEIPNG